MRVTSVRRQSRARLPGARRSGECARRPRRDGSSVVRWERAYHLDQFAPHAHLSLNLFCTMAAQVSADYGSFVKDRLVTADERPQSVGQLIALKC